MGRHELILMHTREMRMLLTKAYVTYVIPVLDDKIGQFHSAEVRNGFIYIKYIPGHCEKKLEIESKKAIVDFSE
jgi:hypothetical protein